MARGGVRKCSRRGRIASAGTRRNGQYRADAKAFLVDVAIGSEAAHARVKYGASAISRQTIPLAAVSYRRSVG